MSTLSIWLMSLFSLWSHLSDIPHWMHAILLLGCHLERAFRSFWEETLLRPRLPHVLLHAGSVYMTIKGNESYTLGQSFKSSIAIQCYHRHPFLSLGNIPCILCTVLQNHDPTATGSHHFRSSGSLKKGPKNVLPSQKRSLKPEETWTLESICMGKVEAPGALCLAQSNLCFTESSWTGWCSRVGMHCQPCQLKHQIPED